MASSEGDHLLGGIPSSSPAALPSDDGAVLEEYGSIGMTLVETAEHEPVLQHDFGGPVVLEQDTLLRHDSLLSNISDNLYKTDEEGLPMLPHEDVAELGGQATIPSEVANLTKNLVSQQELGFLFVFRKPYRSNSIH